MVRRLLAVAFVLAALAPEAYVSAQQSTQSHAATASKATSSKTTAAQNAKKNGKNMHRRNVPPWANSVYVNGGTAAQYLATSSPKPPPGKNKVNKDGPEVFKSISN